MTDTIEICKYLPLVHAIARRVFRTLHSTGLEEGDLISWGFIGLQDGLKKYDSARNPNRFNFLAHKIQWSISEKVRAYRKAEIHSAYHFDKLEDYESTQDSSQEHDIDRFRIWKAIQSLEDEKHRTILEMHYYQGLTLSEIGEMWGFSKQRAHQVLKEALGQLHRDPLFNGV